MTGPISQGVGGAADYRFDSQGGQNAESGDTYSTTGGANPNINIFGPPEDMKTLVYSPQVRVLIAHRGRQYDVSKDLIRGTVIRKENSASSLFFTLANNGDYTGLFDRMDRVTVFMKRIRFQQVFSGYLDTVPYKQLYGGHAEFKATCTLKRLMHTWWNPRLTEAASIFDQYITGALGDGQGGRDSGLGNMLRNILHNVGKWDQDKIHIQNFPLQFYTFLQEQLFVSRSGNQQQADKFKHLLLGTDYNTMAPGNYAGFTNAAGPAGAQSLGEPFYLQEIVAACDMKGLGPNQVDMTNSQQLAEASAIGANSSDLDGAQQEAFTQIQQSATNWNVSTHQNDAAILGVACAMVETGGGATIFNFVNAAVPESLKYVPNDGVRSDGTSVGIMQQTEGNGWGNVAQRMNPRQAASMFFDRLRSLDWRNMDPGVAIQQVQQSAYPARYAPAIQLATQKVQAFRSAQTAGSAAIASNPITAGISTAASAGAGLDLQEAVTSYSSTPLSPEGVSIATNKPYPDSEHAVIEAAAQIGKPYVYGGKGPQSYDCSGLVSWAFRAAGVYVPPQTLAIRDSVPRVATNIPQRGDLVICYNAGHVVLALGPTTCIEAPHPGAFVQVSAMPPIESVHRPAEWGGLGPTSPHLNPLTSGPGAPAGTGTWASSGTGSSGGNEQIARNLFAYHFTPERFASDIAEMFSENHKEYIDAEPLIQTAQAVSRASLRNFASAPNGDFMAYYPDYFGLNGTQAVVQLEDIELKDVKINFSDDNLTTHVYVAGERDTQTGEEINVYDWLASAGSVTVEHEWLFARLRQISPGDLQDASGRELMKRFGVRPFKMPFPMAATEALEFLLACQIFMEKWAMQYQTTASFTFLPELFPGMRVILNGHNLQVYVSEVVHTFDFEQGFQTQAVISAPSVPGAAGRMSFDGFGGGGIPTTDTNILSGLGFGYSFSNSSVVPGL